MKKLKIKISGVAAAGQAEMAQRLRLFLIDEGFTIAGGETNEVTQTETIIVTRSEPAP